MNYRLPSLTINFVLGLWISPVTFRYCGMSLSMRVIKEKRSGNRTTHGQTKTLNRCYRTSECDYY